MSTNDNSRVQRGAPSGALLPTDAANQSQEVARTRPAPRAAGPPRSERVCRLTAAIGAMLERYRVLELGLDRRLIRAALEAGLDVGWEVDDLVAALARLREGGDLRVVPSRGGGVLLLTWVDRPAD